MEEIFDRNIFQRAATPCLKDAAKLLDSLGANWWCEAGTCLGIIRDGDFIAHDSDIDIGLTDWERAEEIEAAFLKDGFIPIHTYGTYENGYEIALSKHGVKIDLFFFYHAGDKIWHSAWEGDRQLFLDFEAACIEPTQRRDFLGFSVNLPCDTEAYLTARYGDWHIVKKDWNWNLDPLCLRK